jgi:hypothetical protein
MFVDLLRPVVCRGRCKNMDLVSLLVTPIQRVPRYRLLLEELVKVTPPFHKDRPALQKALSAVSQTVGGRGLLHIIYGYASCLRWWPGIVLCCLPDSPGSCRCCGFCCGVGGCWRTFQSAPTHASTSQAMLINDAIKAQELRSKCWKVQEQFKVRCCAYSAPAAADRRAPLPPPPPPSVLLVQSGNPVCVRVVGLL